MNNLDKSEEFITHFGFCKDKYTAGPEKTSPGQTGHSSLLSPISCLLPPISCLLSPASCLTCIKFFIPVLSTRDRLRTGASSLRDFKTNPPRISAESFPGPFPLLRAEDLVGSSTPGWREDMEGRLAPSPPLECDAIPKAALVLTPYPCLMPRSHWPW